MSENEISYHQAIDMMEEFRLIMKRIHKKSDTPYRKPEFQAMLFLSSREKITMQELGEELCVTKPRVTALVSELLEKDFVVQSTDEKDKRKKYLSLSEKGIECIESHRKAYETWFKSMWDKFDAREKDAFNILLTKTNLVLREELKDKEDNNETN
ncbi:MarR family transcriptional regulator [uncultured Gemella sp.]|uniref:MarR family winged helix-turn-helix transcriptional regulator n=1 Tax=uncultured Gemella sp. TaxID=254352 RepID=UPI0028E7633C|nr:MarR family transcriptional regulator [uncultured Gemella sp.]